MQMRVVGCVLEFNNEFVLLYRHSHKPDGDSWGLPSGKVEPNEKDDDAMIRELYEETGYTAAYSELQKLREDKFISPSGQTLDFVTYKVSLKNPHQIILEDSAHAKYKWVSPQEAYEMSDLIYGLHNLLKMVGYIN
jgi:8-oxo-dGTP pyrophosphatase MutT (NUDIX family)